MPTKRCGWHGCRKPAEKHVVFAVRVHDAAAGRETAGADPLPNRLDVCRLHAAQVERSYMRVEVRDLSVNRP